MNASKNHIRIIADFSQPRLRKLELNDNKIHDLSNFKGISSNLKVLCLANNRIADLSPLANMPYCEELYVSGNKITSIKELQNMPSLKVLHMRGNRMAKIEEVFNGPKLEYINLRDNAKLTADGLEKLCGFKLLSKVNMQGCPAADSDDFKKDLLIATENIDLKKINKEDVTDEDRQEAKDLKVTRA